MTEVIMPKMGDGMEEGTLLEWLKKEGDAVKSGEVIGNIQTDKATLELEAPGTGVLSGILINEGETVPVGQAIAALLKEGEKLPSGWGGGKSATAAVSESKSEAPAPEAKTEEAAPATPKATEAPAPEESAKSNGSTAGANDRVKASPLARRMAKELGVELSGVKGSGPGGRIVEKDVRSAGKAPAQKSVPVAASAEDQVVSLNRLRQITAKRTQESKQQVPHFYVTVEVDVEKILALRAMFEEEESGKVSINDFVVKACALALRDMPGVNATFQGDKLLQYGGVHVGIAVALEDGLTVPVVHNADQLSLRAISARVRDLAGRAKENKLSLDELTGSTFSISNMGMLDVDNFLAIVNQPNSAILAISSVRKRVVATEDDEIEIRSRMNITCSFDHRVADGAVGAKFINVVKDYLENPTRLLN
ncbi:MAG TPA: dihydrolipoamide acetyltransferase family protein [Fimbriimonadaceae bacterium]|nr:dihydrolipoamide acetyltransferase family protein [Fimbriimonadaceae bacterium]